MFRELSVRKFLLSAMLMVPMASLSGNSVITSIWNLIWGFLQGIMSAIVGSIQSVIYAIGGAFVQILFSWASSVAGYGIWAFLIAGISLMSTFFVSYFLMDFVGDEKAVLGLEEGV